MTPWEHEGCGRRTYDDIREDDAMRDRAYRRGYVQGGVDALRRAATDCQPGDAQMLREMADEMDKKP